MTLHGGKVALQALLLLPVWSVVVCAVLGAKSVPSSDTLSPDQLWGSNRVVRRKPSQELKKALAFRILISFAQ